MERGSADDIETKCEEFVSKQNIMDVARYNFILLVISPPPHVYPSASYELKQFPSS